MKDRQFSAFMADIENGSPSSHVIARHQRAIFPYPEKGGASFHDSLEYRKSESFTCWVYQEVSEIKIEVRPSVKEFRSLKVSLLIPSNK